MRPGRPILVLLAVLALAGLAFGLVSHYRPESGSTATAVWQNPTGLGASGTDEPSKLLPASPQPLVSPLSPTAVTSMHVAFPSSGPGTFRYASTTGPVLGVAGPIRRFRVAIESNIKATVATMAAFTAKIDKTLADARSWIGSGQIRLQQVPATSAYQFTIYLVTEETSARMCAPLYTGGYTSCRQGSHVVLNLDRWMTSVPEYVKARIPLDSYRTYMINHEVGHALGHGHELCPGSGRLAPVMEQQTLGLHGCEPNFWPYVNGKRYHGPLGHY